MYADHHHSPNYSSPSSAPSCYFSIAVPASSVHFSLDTPTTTPLSDYSQDTFSDPCHPLLAIHPPPHESMSNSGDASRLLQLQTAAAHRPTADPLQHRGSTSSSNSSDSGSSSSSSQGSSSGVMSPQVLSCCRCRRESLMGMIQFSTNIYYCSHCARMVGYSAG
jgi:hypothetical protein